MTAHQVAEASPKYLAYSEARPVSDGYKQTEVGTIPEDWRCEDIGHFKPFVTSGSRGWAAYYSDYGNPFVRITNASRKSIYLDMSDTKFVSLPSNASEGSRTSLINGDVLISITADIGISSYVDDRLDKPAYINQHMALVRFEDPGINSKFVAYFLSSENVQRLFRSGSDQGAKAGMNLAGVCKIRIAAPPPEEQTAIANALSDVDCLLSELEKLIAKKLAIKTTTMQQLLTGRTRLPQFALREDGSPKGYKKSELGEIPEDWKVVSLGNASTFINGRAYALHEWEANGTPVIRLQNLTGRGEDYYYSNLQLPEKNYCDFGDLLFMWSATFGPVIWKGERAIYHYHIWKLACAEGYNQSFMFYLLDDMTEKLKRGSSSGGTMLHVTKGKMESTKAVFPLEEEQRAIATILSDMDEEIQALEQRLAKTRQIKQGMMQELLTGKTRLV